MVAGLPPDPDITPTGPEYVQHLRERLELAHQIVREALGESVQCAKRQYDKNCCHTQYHVGDAVWYLIKGTRKVKNKVRKFLPSYVGPFFILGQLDDLVYRIQKGPKTKAKLVHHDQLTPYRCRDPLDNIWAMQQAQSWTPMEVGVVWQNNFTRASVLKGQAAGEDHRSSLVSEWLTEVRVNGLLSEV